MSAPRPPLQSLADALAQLLGCVAALGDVETVSTFDADGRTLAQDLSSAIQVPAQDNSSMDGYALRCADVLMAREQSGGVLPVTQRIAAGSCGGTLAPMSVARIFTGAPIPAGADAVVMQEDCEVVETAAAMAAVRIRSVPTPGQWIRRAAEDVGRGAVVLARGTRLGPAALGLAASIGLEALPVTRRPRVALLSTGDELVMPGAVAPQQMRPGALYNSNRFLLRALLQRLGCTVNDLGVVPDRLDATVEALRDAARHNDLILSSGGVSVGEEDHVKPAVQSLGSLDLWQIAIKPGKPFAYGRVQGTHFIGLPGNPVSSLITFLLLVRPFLLKLQGAADLQATSISAVAHFQWPRPDRRREFLRVRRNAAGGLDLFANQSSAVLTSAVWADGLLDNPPDQTIAYGDVVRFIPFAEVLG